MSADLTASDINARKVGIYQTLQIVRNLKFQQCGQTLWTVEFNSYRSYGTDENMNFCWCFSDPVSMAECHRQIVQIVEHNAPSGILAIVRRILGGFVELNAELMTWSLADRPKRSSLTFPKDYHGSEAWTRFYHNLDIFTRTHDEVEYKFRVYADLGMLVEDRDENGYRLLVNSTKMHPHRPVHIFRLGDISDRTNKFLLVEEVQRECLRQALSLANMVLDGYISDAKVLIVEATTDKVVKRIQFRRQGQLLHTKDFTYTADATGHYVCSDLYEAALELAKTGRQDESTETLPALTLAPVPPISLATCNDTERMGIYQVLDIDPGLVIITEAGDGTGHCSTSTKHKATKCLVEIDKNEPHPWIAAAIKFTRLYDPAKEYIILADCCQQDLKHPALTLYRTFSS